MRDLKKLIDNHPRVPADLSRGDKHIFVATEVALAFLATYLPHEKVMTFPGLMMGYPDLVSPAESTDESSGDRSRAYAAVRHICVRVSTRLGWEQAVHRYFATPESERCFAPEGEGVRTRTTAPEDSLEYLRSVLLNKVPRRKARVSVAEFDEAFVHIARGQATVKVRIPQAIVDPDVLWDRYPVALRKSLPPIEIDWERMQTVACEVDEEERNPTWPVDSLPALDLATRLKKVLRRDVAGVFPESDKIRLEGPNHVVGMLSSGKSSLALGILFYMARELPYRRCAVIAGNTQEAAALAARLRRHGIKATLFASFRNRGDHLGAALRTARRAGLAGGGLDALGTIPSMFETGCPLNGAQGAQPPEVVRENREGQSPSFPRFEDRPCSSLRPAPDKGRQDCPLWPKCPAHAQERAAAEAQVWIFTPAAFTHMDPSNWMMAEEMTFPELVQHACDLVIIDEADSVQGVFDELFALRDNIMADAPDAFGPYAMEKPVAAIRALSAGQVRSPMERDWIFRNLAFQTVLWRIYDVMENNKDKVRRCYWNRFFTAESILVELARARLDESPETGGDAPLSGRSSENAGDLMDVLRCASSIRDAVFERPGRADAPREDAYAKAGATLKAIAMLAQAPGVTTDSLIEQLQQSLTTTLEPFSPKKVRGRVVDDEDKAATILLGALTGIALSLYAWLTRSLPGVEESFRLPASTSAIRSRRLIDRYRSLIPQNPAGAALGLFYEDPAPGNEISGKGGSLRLIHHAGVGRYLLAQLHNLLGAEGQVGPHTLLLSGTSWAGGAPRRDSENRVISDDASPIYDVQVPVKGILEQPKREVAAIGRSVFGLVKIAYPNGEAVKVSGTHPTNVRPGALRSIAQYFSDQTADGKTRFDLHWQALEKRWADEDIADRKRVLVVTNSYDDAFTFAKELGDRLRGPGHHGSSWSIRHLIPDRQGEERAERESTPYSSPLERSRVERFGGTSCPAVLVAPIQVISRGHNILNRDSKAAISAIYFVHRPHHRPDDFMQVISRVNRVGQDIVENGVPEVDRGATPTTKVEALRKRGRAVQREALGRARYGYSNMDPPQQEQFAWSTITTLWQVIGRGIRAGCPVYVGFVDAAFAPESFDGAKDDGSTSVLVRCIEVLERRMNEDREDSELARSLYRPFYDALKKTKDLIREKEIL